MELSVRQVCKSFGAGNVLDGVDLTLRGGEICAFLGANGAGKSTLMNILGGVFQPDSGDIFIDGRRVTFSSPADSLSAGIAFIHQECNLVPDLTVYENLFLSAFPKKGLLLDRVKMVAQASRLFDRLGFDIDPEARVGDLDPARKQLAEIGRALMQDASLVIMDEPTSSLTAEEIKRVFDAMRTLREQNIAVVFISHKLDEVMQICDRYTVLRNGKIVESGNVADVTPHALASAIVGKELDTERAHKSHAGDEERLVLDHLSDGENFFDVSLCVRSGEVLGVTGLLGDGRSELFSAVFGATGGNYTGSVYVDGKPVHPRRTHEARRLGLAYLPKDRKENAILADMDIADNGTAATLKSYRKGVFFDRKKQHKDMKTGVDALHIHAPDVDRLVTTLSGGNQQKVVLERWILSGPRVLILDNPTQGIDVGAREDLYDIIGSLAASGIAVVVLSSEAREICRVCDRVLIMRTGRIVAELTGERLREKEITELVTGAEKEESQ